MARILPERKNPNEPYEKLRTLAAHARRPFDRDYWLNVAFYLGEQYTEWHVDSQNIRHIPRKSTESRRPRPVVNKINHFVSQQHAFALQTKPTVDVLPATDDPTDISDALVARAYLENLFDPQVMNFYRRLSGGVLWALTPGEGYLKWCWDPKLKRPDVYVLSPFEMLADPYATDFTQARWAIHTRFMDTEAVYDAWGHDVEAEQVERQDATKAALLRDMGSAPAVKGVTVNELWMLPSRRHPKGQYVVWTGKTQLMSPGPFPYKHCHLPFTQLGTIPRPGSQHYDSHVKYLRSPQMELNKYHAQRIRVRENYASPKWWLDTDLELEELPNDDPDQQLKGHGGPMGKKPELIQGGQFPDNQEGEWITDEMMNVVGQHEVSQAQVPGRVESAKAIELLKEADATRLSELIDTIRDAIGEGGWQCLQLARQYSTAEDIVPIYSREGLPEVKRFLAGEWKAGMRVRTAMGTGLARSRAARQDQLIRMWELQIITDPEKMADLLEVPLPMLLSARAFDVKLARNENYTLAAGNAVKPNSWDDHEIHLREHNNYRKTHEYLELSNDAKARFEHHCQTHDQLQANEIQKQTAKQMLATGQQPGAPGASAETAGQTTPGDAPAMETQPP